MKTLKRYPGAKAAAGVAHRIIRQMPPHSTYIEAFAGSAAVFFMKLPAARSLLIEKDLSVAASLIHLTDGDPRVRVLNADALDVLARLAFAGQITPQTVIYADPPYVLSTRGYRTYYQHELTEADHCRLLAILNQCGGLVLLSGYRSDLYDGALHGWRRIDYQVMTHGGLKCESLWCNFPEPQQLHDWRQAGQGFRARLSLRRRAQRWLDRLRGLKAPERQFLLSYIHAKAPHLLTLRDPYAETDAGGRAAGAFGTHAPEMTLRDPRARNDAEDRRADSGAPAG